MGRKLNCSMAQWIRQAETDMGGISPTAVGTRCPNMEQRLRVESWDEEGSSSGACRSHQVNFKQLD